jgi:chromosome segregation ATPase
MVTCEICGKEVRTTQALRGHKNFVHGITRSSTVARPAAEKQVNIVERVEKLESIVGTMEPTWLEQTLGFPPASLGERVDQLTGRLNDLEKRLTDYSERLGQYSRQLDNFSTVNEKLGELTKVNSQFSRRLDRLTAAFNSANEDIGQLFAMTWRAMDWHEHIDDTEWVNSEDGKRRNIARVRYSREFAEARHRRGYVRIVHQEDRESPMAKHLGSHD